MNIDNRFNFGNFDIEKMIKNSTKLELSRFNDAKKEKLKIDVKNKYKQKMFKEINDFIINSNKNTTNIHKINNENFEITSKTSTSFKIGKVSKLASKDKYFSDKINYNAILGTTINIEKIKKDGVKFNIIINNQIKKINVENVENLEDLKNKINDKILDEFGEEYNNVFNLKNNNFEVFKPGNKIILTNDYDDLDESIFKTLGFNSGDSSHNSDILKIIKEDTIFTINNKEIKITTDDNLKNIKDKFKKIDINLNFDELSGKVILESNKEGVANSIKLDENAKDFLNEYFGINELNHIKAENLNIEIDGENLSFQSNSFSYKNSEIFIKNTKENSDDINVKINPQDTISSVKDFIENYNKLTKSLRNKYKGIGLVNLRMEILSEEEKEQLSKNDLKLYNENLEKSILYKDKMIDKILISLRNSFTSKAEDLNKMGIKVNYKGELQLDEEKLNFAINNGVNINEYMFDGKESFKNKITDILKLRISSKDIMGEKFKLKNINYNIDKARKRLEDKEEYYYDMYSKLDNMITQINSQTNFFLNMLGQ